MIAGLTTNLTEHPNGHLPQYAKFELTFTVATLAANPFWPYDVQPPPGVEPGLGVTVNALFTPDDWQTVYSQPAFWHQAFIHEHRAGNDWIYPTDNHSWKVRFSPDQPGVWRYKLVAQDAGGVSESPSQTFVVVASANRGFVKVSPHDPRYFEFDNGEYFLGLGYNLTYGQIDWDNPSANQARFQALQHNGLQLFRTWLSQWGIFTSAWGVWNSPLPEKHTLSIPDPSLSWEQSYPGSDIAMLLTWNTNPAMFLGFLKRAPAVKPNTTYQIAIRYLIPRPLQGPRRAGHPYGLVAKTGRWLAGPEPWPGNLAGLVDPGTGVVVSRYAAQSPRNGRGDPEWSTLAGELTTGPDDYLPYFYLVLENLADNNAPDGDSQNGGNQAFIDRVEIREVLGNGRYGPNILSRPWLAQHFYVDQHYSYTFDQVLELAAKYDLYFKVVVSEKNVWDLNVIDHAGNFITDPRCWDPDLANNPASCPASVHWFYGNGRQMSKVRWLQQSWWRYLQARWGYSPHIHSWELVNEGDPASELHYALADEFAKYMHQFGPNSHLVTTSFWHSFPSEQFWANPAYPNLDYADLHHYEAVADVAENTAYFSLRYGALGAEGARKPLVRGETAYSDEILRDRAGIWLHNLIWAGVNPGGMLEQYWHAAVHIEQPDQNNDLRYHYRVFRQFMAGIPLNNGHYQDAKASTTQANLRVWGQKDLTHGCAHLWLQNKQHTWQNVVDQLPITPISGAVAIRGFRPGERYTLQWWDPYQVDQTADTVPTQEVVAEGGVLSFQVTDLTTDLALKVISARGCGRTRQRAE